MALTSSAWSYDTSEDHSASVFFISGGYGTIYLKNETEQLRMSIPYKYAALGESNGLDLGFSWADADYLGTGELMTFDYHYFSDLDFPSGGFVASTGISAITGVSASLWIFGVTSPFALLKTAGGFMALGGGVGISVGAATFGSPTTSQLIPQGDDSDSSSADF